MYCSWTNKLGAELETSVTSIDPLEVFATQAERLAANVARYNTQLKQFRQLREYSTSAALLERLRADHFATDLLFFDGDHSYAQVRADWDAYRGFVRPGGFIVFDDYGMADSLDVKKAVDGIVLSLAQESNEREVAGLGASADVETWRAWGQRVNEVRAPPANLTQNEFILHRETLSALSFFFLLFPLFSIKHRFVAFHFPSRPVLSLVLVGDCPLGAHQTATNAKGSMNKNCSCTQLTHVSDIKTDILLLHNQAWRNNKPVCTGRVHGLHPKNVNKKVVADSIGLKAIHPLRKIIDQCLEICP